VEVGSFSRIDKDLIRFDRYSANHVGTSLMVPIVLHINTAITLVIHRRTTQICQLGSRKWHTRAWSLSHSNGGTWHTHGLRSQHGRRLWGNIYICICLQREKFQSMHESHPEELDLKS